MKTIMLPLWVEKHAHEHAANFAEHEAGETDPNSPSYQRAYKQAFKKFCLEYYEHSLIPAETEDSIRGNPYQHAATAAFRNFVPGGSEKPVDITDKNFFTFMFKNSKIPQADLKRSVRRFTAAINTLQDVYLDANFGPQGNKNKFRVYDHQKKLRKNFKRKAGEKPAQGTEVDSERTLTGLDYRSVIINRYVRLFIASMLLATVRAAFKTDSGIIREAVITSLDGVPSGDLNKKANTDAFSTAVFNGIADETTSLPDKFAIQALKNVKFKISDQGEPTQLAEGKAEAKRESSQIAQEMALAPQTPAPTAQVKTISELMEEEIPDTVEQLEESGYEVEAPKAPVQAPIPEIPSSSPVFTPQTPALAAPTTSETAEIRTPKSRKAAKELLSASGRAAVEQVYVDLKLGTLKIRAANAKLTEILKNELNTAWSIDKTTTFGGKKVAFKKAKTEAARAKILEQSKVESIRKLLKQLKIK